MGIFKIDLFLLSFWLVILVVQRGDPSFKRIDYAEILTGNYLELWGVRQFTIKLLTEDLRIPCCQKNCLDPLFSSEISIFSTWKEFSIFLDLFLGFSRNSLKVLISSSLDWLLYWRMYAEVCVHIRTKKRLAILASIYN